MRLSVVVHVTGTLVLMFSPSLLAPAAVAAWYREWWDAAGFLLTSAVTAASTAGQAASTPARCG